MNLADRDYFRAIMRGAPYAVSDLLQGKLTKAPGVILAVPLRGPGGELRGVVGGVINLSLDNFLRELSRSPVGVTGSYCLVSSGPNPRYAMHRDAAKLLTSPGPSASHAARTSPSPSGKLSGHASRSSRAPS